MHILMTMMKQNQKVCGDNLEAILTKAKVPFTKSGIKRKKEYIKLFPTDDRYGKTDVVQIEDLAKHLSKIKETNFNEFLEFCLIVLNKII